MAELTEKVMDFFTNAEVNMETLKDVLSEFLAVELGGQKSSMSAPLSWYPIVRSKLNFASITGRPSTIRKH